ncbi:MAG: AMP-binding protein, partial [bacterium]|nr:AMP-binding protein [bacterium]
VGVHDNFFDLGGHSLLATQVISRIRRTFQVELPLPRIFEYPTVAELARSITTARREEGLEVPPLVPVTRDRAPLSFAQERLWFLDQFEPGTTALNMPVAVRLAGAVDVGLLERIFHEVVRRHEGLRTSFAPAAERPVQVIAEPVDRPLPLADLRQLPEIDREAEARRLIRREELRRFDLTTGPLIRFSLLRLGDQEHVALVTMHHIVTDGWSMRVFVRELAVLYEALSQGRPSPLPELPVQYADFAHWQREWLRGEVLEAQLGYWREQLAGSPPVLELPADRPRPAVQTYRGERLALELSRELSEKLRELSRRRGATLYMTLLAAFDVLLYRTSGQDDVAVGTPIAGRTRDEVEGLIGFFLNSLVLRTDLSGNPPFTELLGRVREVCLGAYAHQDVPFEKLLEELDPERDLSRTPLFQVFFNMLNLPADDIRLPGLNLELLTTPEPPSKFDLTVYLVDLPEGIHTNWVYNSDLFDRARMVEVLAQFESLLDQLVEDPARPIDRFRLVTRTAEALLPDPGEELDAAWHGPVQEAFATQARRRPDSPAVVDRHGIRSYGKLDAESNRLGHYLRARGVGSEDVVAIYGHRSAALVWAVLGVMKAGAAFLILDPDY